MLDNLDQLLNSSESGLSCEKSDGVFIVTHEDQTGDMPIYVMIDNDQMLAYAPVCKVSDVKSEAEFNQQVLKASVMLPLAAIGVMEMGADQCYVVFGQCELPVSAGDEVLLSTVVNQLTAISSSVIDVTEIVSEHL